MNVVGDVMTANPQALRPEDSIRQAAQMMRDGDYGAVPIIDGGGALVGIVTDRDIVVNAVAAGRGSDTRVVECMTRDPESVTGDTTLEQAMALMATRQIRRLPVVENGRLIGMLSLGDLAMSGAPEGQKAEVLEEVSEEGGDLRTTRVAFDR